MVEMESVGFQDLQAGTVPIGLHDLHDLHARTVPLGIKEKKETLEHRALLDPGVGGSLISGGAEPPACPDTEGTELVYAGRAAGSHYTHSGGGSNYQCVTEEPENFDFGPGTVDHALLYGAEYEFTGNIPSASLPLHDQDVPCAVCYVAPRETVLMIPGRYTCPPEWTREYYGYLMAERYSHQGRSTFECVDVAPETITGGHADHDGALFHHVEPRCGSLPCPPYDQQKEMTCAVCSR